MLTAATDCKWHGAPEAVCLDSPRGLAAAREVLHLARGYGASILRNALAEAMRIEDGDIGL